MSSSVGEAEGNGLPSASSSPRGQSAQNALPEDMFVRHKVRHTPRPAADLACQAQLTACRAVSVQVSKLDTLAGLAIRYHVTVSQPEAQAGGAAASNVAAPAA